MQRNFGNWKNAYRKDYVLSQTIGGQALPSEILGGGGGQWPPWPPFLFHYSSLFCYKEAVLKCETTEIQFTFNYTKLMHLNATV